MTKAYLGSIVRLQLRVSPQRVKECLDRWCSMLAGRQSHKTGCRMRAIVRETLYRDIIGFIPVYSLVFAFGLWFGAWQLGWAWLQSLWLIVPLTAATADYIEDICHLRYLRLHERNEAPSLLLTWLGAAMTSIKLIAFIGEGALTFVIVIVATLRIHSAPELYGWRGLLALAVSIDGVCDRRRSRCLVRPVSPLDEGAAGSRRCRGARVTPVVAPAAHARCPVKSDCA